MPQVALLTSTSTIIDRTGSTAVAHAGQALERDLQAKLSHETGGKTGVQITLDLDPALGPSDRYRISATPTAITIAGSEPLGCIHGIYAFAERFLDADPMQWVTRAVPQLCATVAVPIGRFDAPDWTFRHRGFFFSGELMIDNEA